MSKLKSKKHNILYKTTNRHNGHFYIGVHATDNLDDGYMGSGRLLVSARKKYGRQGFTREVIRDFDTVEEAYRWESMIVGDDLINDPNCYNLSVGGAGCPVGRTKGSKRTPEQIAQIRANHRGMTGKVHTEETKRKIRSSSLATRKMKRDQIAKECREMSISNRIK